MSNEINLGSQKLGVLIDETVNSKTLNWINSLDSETIVRNAAVACPTNDSDLKNFINRLLTAEIDIAIFVTSAGLAQFFNRASKSIDRLRLIASLSDIKTIAVGSLVEEKMAELGIHPTIVLDDVGWRDILVELDQQCPMANLTIGLEETSNVHGMAAGFEARGASVARISAIAFKQTDPSSAEQDILDAIEDGELGTMLLPNPLCAARFAALVQGRERPVLKQNALQLVVLALGADTQQMLVDRGVACDVVLSRDQLRTEIKTSVQAVRVLKNQQNEQLSGPATNSGDRNAPWFDSPFMKALRLEPTDVTPVWMMRQAGRYMKEYRDVREKVAFLDLCKNPQLCSEVMCTAVEKLGVDAAIIFSDLLPILEPMGCELEYAPSGGPVIHNPVRTVDDIDRIAALDSIDRLQFVMDTVRQTRTDLPEDIPLIGFAGAPFTLASYMIEGGATKDFAQTKRMMFADLGAWNELMSKLVRSITVYLKGQIEAGAQCIQLFDSWAGCLSIDDYRIYVLPFVSKIIDAIVPLAPVINFATGNPALLAELANTKAQAIGIDWRIGLGDAWKFVGYDRAVQGNLDPTVLLTTPAIIREKVKDILDQAEYRNGHIFNLGHGILPQTPVDNAIALVDIVHELSQK